MKFNRAYDGWNQFSVALLLIPLLMLRIKILLTERGLLMVGDFTLYLLAFRVNRINLCIDSEIATTRDFVHSLN